MPPHMISEMENKLVLLHVVDSLGAITAQQLLRFMVECDIMDYITMQLTLAELSDAEQLEKSPHELGTLYSVSERGKQSLSLFIKRVPPSRLLIIDGLTSKWRERFRREKHLLADWKRDEKGNSYTAHLRVLEGDVTLLSLHVNLPTRRQAEHFCNVWSDQASEVYKLVLYTLGEAVAKPSPDL